MSRAGLLVEQSGRVVMRAKPQISGGDQQILLRQRCRRTAQQLIASELLADKLVVRLIGIERANHVIAKPPGLRTKLVPIKAIAVAVANHVEPQPRRVLAIAWRSQELVDQSFVGIRPLVA